MKKVIAILMILIMSVSIWGCSVGNGPLTLLNMDEKLEPGDMLLDAGISDIMDAEAGIWDSGESTNANSQITAGLLTAGEWKDLDNQEFWTKLLNRNDWYQLMETRNLFANKIVTVRVLDSEQKPCFNVKVELNDEDGKVLYTARTDVNGYAYLLYDLNDTGEEAYSVTINSKHILLEGKKNLELSVSLYEEVTKLDLMFMIDTTGSMCDELEYLQKEVEDVIKRVAKENKAVSINVSVNFYRDESDEYVVLDNPFYSNIEKNMTILNEQYADGGGDFPEAVHLAINNAVNEHQWRDDSVKLCFMVLDAPPHSEEDIIGIDKELKEYVMDAAEKGIRIIPVASSGVDTETEFLMRSYAVMTGGTYVFLTNDSGIGNEHLEPTIGEYEVKPLNDLMVEIILSYCKAK